MKYIKLSLALVSFLFCSNLVIAQGQRTVADPGAAVEARSVENIIKNTDDFVSVTPGSKAKKMSTKSIKDKTRINSSVVTGIMATQPQLSDNSQAQSDSKNPMKKFTRFPENEGEKKNRKPGVNQTM